MKKKNKKDKKNKLAMFGKVFYWLILAFLIIIAITTVLSAFDVIKGVRVYTVQSGSMEPAIHVGSVVVSKKSDSYQVDDVITYKKEEDRLVKNPKYTTTHRIKEIQSEEEKTSYITQGDANEAPDSIPVSQDLVAGKVVFTTPYLGYPVSFAKTETGLITLIIIPATLIIYSEVMNIKKEAKKLIDKKKKKK